MADGDACFGANAPTAGGRTMKRQMLFVFMSLMIAVGASAQEAAQAKPKILRYDPKGVGDWESKGEAGAPKSYSYYKSTGVWTSNREGGKLHTVNNTELIKVLEGTVTFEDKNGKETVFKPGDVVVIPRGTEFVWKKSSNFREYWVIADRAVEGTPAPEGMPTFYKLEPDGPAGKGMTPGRDGKTKGYRYHRGADGSSIGVWETQPVKEAEFTETKYAELMMFLKGNVTLSTSDGQVEHFKAGDVALVPKGIKYKWESDTARKYYVIFDTPPPSANATRQQ
jgi:uncharacterized cupin superfamily protein